MVTGTFASEFFKDDDGAVTVDWVVLTAAIIGLGLVTVASIAPGAWDLAESIGLEMTDRGLGTSG